MLLHVFLPGGIFRACDHGLDFDINLLFMEESNQQSIKVRILILP